MRKLVFSYNPHAILGLHARDEGKVIRLWRPRLSQCILRLRHTQIEGKLVDILGLFEFSVPLATTPTDYHVCYPNGEWHLDPYSFMPTFGELDAHLFNQGTHYQLYEVMGGRIKIHQGCLGAAFTVWAPNAKRVALIGDFNQWDSRAHPMRSLGTSGVWELFIPGLRENELYKFSIETQNGALITKADPYAYFSEVRPKTASRLFNVDRFTWSDEEWKKQQRYGWNQPLNIYEVHLGSWKRGLNYPALAEKLAEYCQLMGFTHVELLPLSEHPLDESWGYQVCGFYAVTSRFGTPEEFQFFVNYLHSKGIGIILDWVVAHFPRNDFGLAYFDGTSLYEHEDLRQRIHPHWDTHIFNYGRHEVANFLLANALFWLDKMHIDGLRVDAVASMLYLDYGRKEGEWVTNVEGGKENLEAIKFLKHLNSIVHQFFPCSIICAEESTSFPRVSLPTEWGGLGFDIKWNMGWMNDTLRYFRRDPLLRCYHQDDLTFGLLYAFSERFILTLSHDEVVHGKKSLISKMPGDDWQKFAQVRLLYSYMICQPGKKLLFMGGELGEWEEWDSQGEIHWNLLQYEKHRQLQFFVQSLNHFYRAHPALWENDFNFEGFEWVDFKDVQNSVISYIRKGLSQRLLCLHHFTPTYLPSYFIPLFCLKEIREIFNTDQEGFGGSGKVNTTIEKVTNEKNKVMGFTIQLAPFATMIFEVTFDETR